LTSTAVAPRYRHRAVDLELSARLIIPAGILTIAITGLDAGNADKLAVNTRWALTRM
jgi:hypothetical protein